MCRVSNAVKCARKNALGLAILAFFKFSNTQKRLINLKPLFHFPQRDLVVLITRVHDLHRTWRNDSFYSFREPHVQARTLAGPQPLFPQKKKLRPLFFLFLISSSAQQASFLFWSRRFGQDCPDLLETTPSSLCHELGPRLFLSLDKHPALGQLPREFCSALPGQSSDRPNLLPYNKVFTFFSFLLPAIALNEILSWACTGLGKRRINYSTCKWSS